MSGTVSVEQHRHECECREWLARIRAQNPRSVSEGVRLLDLLITEISKKRGSVAAERLRDGIEAARKESK